MTPSPIALGLFLCDMVITDQRRQCPTPVNIFNKLGVNGFPSGPTKMSVFAALTDAQGHGAIELEVVRLDTGDRIYIQRSPFRCPHRHAIVNVNVRLRQLRFPSEGLYEFVLRVDGELIALRRLRVHQSTED